MISARLRYEVLRRDGFKCSYCHRSDQPLTIDHVVAVALGGEDLPENLVASCGECNGGKASTGPSEELVAEVDSRAVEWTNAMRRAAEVQAARADDIAAHRAEFDAAWSAWTYGDGAVVSRPPTWPGTVAAWHNAGLDARTLRDLVNDVLPRSVPDGRMWVYFCGAVRNVLRERQAIALALLETEGAANGAQ